MNNQSPENQSDNKNVLVVEDSKTKWDEVNKLLLKKTQFNINITHAKTLVDAEKYAVEHRWDLIILDVSMDIRSSTIGPKGGGQDALGGLKFSRKMYLLGKESPTVLLTAFDAFPTRNDRPGATILGLEEVQSNAEEILGHSLLGCVRYGDPEWREQLSEIIDKALRR